MDTKKIGAFLKQCRKEKNLTQEQLAEKFRVSARTVSRWETGTMDKTKSTTGWKSCICINVCPKILLYGGIFLPAYYVQEFLLSSMAYAC